MKNDYYVEGDTAYVKINHKNGDFYTMIDKEQLNNPEVNENKWAAMKKKEGEYYIFTRYWINKKRRKHVWLHRVISRPPTTLVVDHINRNPLDNRCENLRIVTAQENMMNRGFARVTPYRGGYRCRVRAQSISVDKIFKDQEVANEFAGLLERLVFLADETKRRGKWPYYYKNA